MLVVSGAATSRPAPNHGAGRARGSILSANRAAAVRRAHLAQGLVMVLVLAWKLEPRTTTRPLC